MNIYENLKAIQDSMYHGEHLVYGIGKEFEGINITKISILSDEELDKLSRSCDEYIFALHGGKSGITTRTETLKLAFHPESGKYYMGLAQFGSAVQTDTQKTMRVVGAFFDSVKTVIVKSITCINKDVSYRQLPYEDGKETFVYTFDQEINEEEFLSYILDTNRELYDTIHPPKNWYEEYSFIISEDKITWTIMKISPYLD